jgi:hypothetical protein
MHNYQHLICRNTASLLQSNKVRLRRTLKVFRGQNFQQQEQQQQCCYHFRSFATTTTTKDNEYKNFSHKSLIIDQNGHSQSTHDIQQQRQQKDVLVFGKQFTPHMLQIQYSNQQWGEPKIVPYQNLSISPAASSLHYGAFSLVYKD